MAALSTAFMASAALAQTPAPGEGKPAFIPSQAASEWRASNLIGTSVKGPNGDALGDINDVVITQTGNVSAFIIGVGGMLGVGEKNVAVPYQALTLSTGSDGKRTASLNATPDDLKAAPAYEGEKTTFEKVQDKATDLATKAKDKASELATEAKEKATEVKDNYMKENEGTPKEGAPK
jgi:sporulation protein YlmC with PRC-barrel domain